MTQLIAWLSVQANRARLYTAAIVIVPLLVAAGALSSGDAAKVLTLLAAITGAAAPALARKHSVAKKVGR